MNTADNTAMNQCLSRPIFFLQGDNFTKSHESPAWRIVVWRGSEAAGKQSVESLLNVVVNLLKVRQMTPVSRRAAKKSYVWKLYNAYFRCLCASEESAQKLMCRQVCSCWRANHLLL